ncbi:MAG: alpha/beta hydrolase, partial [Mycobacterium sp.]|nr:alpha/beta hydrolase [Mycobacterium sp.]
ADADAADELCEGAVAETSAILLQLTAIRDGYAAALHNGLATMRADGAEPAEMKTVDELLIPPPGANAEQTARWWGSLTGEQQRLLIDQHPQQLGNLGGLPAAVRGRVNHAVLNDDLSRVEDVAQQRGLAAERLRDDALNNATNDVFTNPGSYGLSAIEVLRYQNAVKTNRGLGHDKEANSGRRPVLLWAYDPLAFNGKGRAAIALGDPDKAQNTAVIVPGNNSSVQGGWLYDGHDDAVNLYDQLRKADPNHSTAVLAWMGYSAPDFDLDHLGRAVTDPSRLQEVGTPWLARQGGALLAADVGGLAAAHDGSVPLHTTVIGHSYGATTVADAFANYAMRADDAVLIGCPGTDLARSAADFHLGDGKVYVGAASTDIVSFVGESGAGIGSAVNDVLGEPLGSVAGLGSDPAHKQFGAVRFRAEVAGSHSVVPWFDDHSHYYQMGSEALHNMTEVATGRSGALANEDMIAQPRADERISTPHELHTPFGSLALPHAEIQIPVIADPEWARAADSVTNEHAFK